MIVPVHGVEKWLPSCLDSIAAQSFGDYEVIVVDDGSLDGCAAIAEARVARDSRVRLLRQANAGLGAARNVGVQHARGEFLTFVDGDDEVPPLAWEKMISTLAMTRSDFIAGRADRTAEDGRRWTTPLMSRNHLEERLSVTIEEAPLALADVFAWNKVFRTSFWRDAGLAFPEGVRYEDQPTLTRAFLLARRFDLLTDVVYVWRLRGDNSSITQKRHELADLLDRALTKRQSAHLVLDGASEQVRRVFFAEVLPIDMWQYFRAATSSGPAYWSVLVDLVNDLWNTSTMPFEHTAVAPHRRLMGWLVSQGRRDDLVRWIRALDSWDAPPYRDGVLLHPWDHELELRVTTNGRPDSARPRRLHERLGAT